MPDPNARSVTTYPVTTALLHAVSLDELRNGSAFLSPEGSWTAGPAGEPWPLTSSARAILSVARLNEDGSFWEQYTVSRPRIEKTTHRLAAVVRADGTRVADVVPA